MPRKIIHKQVVQSMFIFEILDISSCSKKYRFFFFIFIQIALVATFYYFLIRPVIHSISRVNNQLVSYHHQISSYREQTSRFSEKEALEKKLLSDIQFSNNKKSLVSLDHEVKKFLKKSSFSEVQIASSVSQKSMFHTESINLKLEGDFNHICIFIFVLLHQREFLLPQKVSLLWLEEQKKLRLSMELDHVFFMYKRNS